MFVHVSKLLTKDTLQWTVLRVWCLLARVTKGLDLMQLANPVKHLHPFLQSLHIYMFKKGFKVNSLEKNWSFRPPKIEILVQLWNYTSRHFKPLSLCWRHHLLRFTASTSTKGQQQHLLAQDWLIGWSGTWGVKWLIDHLGVGVAFIYSPGDRTSGGPQSSVMSNTEGKMRKRWRVVSSLPRHGGHVWSKSRPTWEKGACLENNQTWGQSEDEREGEKALLLSQRW